MNSLEWRIKKLEDRILGQKAGLAYVDRVISQCNDQNNVVAQLDSVAKAHKSFLDITGNKYNKFNELYEKYRSLLTSIDDSDKSSLSSKAELVLAYEDDLIAHMEDLKSLVDKADRVLDIEKWPDMSKFNDKLEKLEKVTKEQHLQSLQVDRKTEELIEIYNDIVNSFKNNMLIWNQKLEAYEDIDKKMDDDE